MNFGIERNKEMTNTSAENQNYMNVGRQENVYEREIWNRAIEAAAQINLFQNNWISEEIRKLKK